MKTRRWIMSKNVTFVLMYHRHKILDHVYIMYSFTVSVVTSQELSFDLSNQRRYMCLVVAHKGEMGST
jgi:hypothetical protein